MTRRVLCVWFPRLASERRLRLRPHDGAFALSHASGGAEHLHCLSPAAEARGLARGMPLATARALCPDLAVAPADLAAEAAFLQALRRWLTRYGPWPARDGAEGLALDLTGGAHLFGGEAALLADLTARLAAAGIGAEAAVADTRGAAHALARHGGGLAPPGRMLEAVGALPLRALRLDAEIADGLARLGVHRIRDLARMPRGPLARRFGRAPLLRLDQALGAAPDPLSPEGEAPHLAVRLSLPEPVGLVSDVEAGLARLLDRLCPRLEAHGLGARRLRLELRRVDGDETAVEIGLARPMRDPARLRALFRKGLEEVEAGFGIERLRLCAPLAEPLRPRQLGPRRAGAGAAGPDAQGDVREDAHDDLMTRLAARLGFERLRRALPADSHIPEKSFLTVPVTWSAPAGPWPGGPERPLRLFPPEPIRVEAEGAPTGAAAAAAAAPPERFRWRGALFTAARAAGPERIAPEWWLDDPAWRSGLRDYWRVETRQGPRLWLFRTPQAPEGAPAWHVQGEFA